MRILFLLAAITITCSCAWGQPQKAIKLKNDPLPYIPQHFYVQRVTDERADTTVLGVMHTLGGLRKVTAVLKDGAATTIGRYLENNVRWDKNAPAVDMHIVQLSLTESNTGMQQQLQIDGTVSFHLEDKLVCSLSYSSFARGMNVEGYTETLIKQFLQGVLKEADDWFGKNKEMTQSGVSVTVEMLRETDNEDLIVYDTKRPLTRKDFAGMPDELSRAGAITNSGILIRYRYETLVNNAKISITVLPYFDKTLSWWVAKQSESLVQAHEQVHFDITAIAACELLHTLQNYTFSPGGFTKEIDSLQKQEDKKRSQMQQQYDRETEHGQNKVKQVEWQKKIAALLAEQDCY